MILYCVLVPIIAVAVVIMLVSGIPLSPSTMTGLASIVLLGCAEGFLFVAIGRVYAERGVGRLVKVLFSPLRPPSR